MKNVIVFDVEKVLFNVIYVENCLKRRGEELSGMDEFEKSYKERSREKYMDDSFRRVRLYKNVKDSVKDLMEIRRRMGGKNKLYVISEFKNEWVWNLMKVNGINVDGIYSSIEKLNNEVDLEGKDVVYLSGIKERVEEGKKIGINSVLCKWGNRKLKNEEGIESGEELLRSVGIIKMESENRKEEKIEIVENIENKVEERENEVEVIDDICKVVERVEERLGEVNDRNNISVIIEKVDKKSSGEKKVEKGVRRDVIIEGGNMEKKMMNDPNVAA